MLWLTPRNIANESYQIVILSNQAGLNLHPDPKEKKPKNVNSDKVANFKQKCSAVLAKLDIPTTLYAATGHDIFRKPRTGMWKEMCKDYGLPDSEIDFENSMFVGDAGGRLEAVVNGGAVVKKDFSCSDRNLAHNIGITYKTPEEFFLDEEPRKFVRDFDLTTYPFSNSSQSQPMNDVSQDTTVASDEDIVFVKKNKQDVVLFCGMPGAGKSTFFWRYLEPLGYERINQDTLKTRQKCFKVAAEHLGAGRSVAIDNTNADPDGRKEWVDLARRHGVPIRCVWLKTSQALCEHNAVVRALNGPALNPEQRAVLPSVAFRSFVSRFTRPTTVEGYEDILEMEFKFRGSTDEYAIWGRYWT